MYISSIRTIKRIICIILSGKFSGFIFFLLGVSIIWLLYGLWTNTFSNRHVFFCRSICTFIDKKWLYVRVYLVVLLSIYYYMVIINVKAARSNINNMMVVIWYFDGNNIFFYLIILYCIHVDVQKKGTFRNDLVFSHIFLRSFLIM